MQSVFDYAKTLKGECSAAISRSVVPDLNGRWSASNLGRNWTKPDTVLRGKQPSAGSLTGRPPDTVLQSMQPSPESFAVRLDKIRHRSSRNAAFGGILNWTTFRRRPSKHAAFGGMLCWTTSRHCRSRDSVRRAVMPIAAVA